MKANQELRDAAKDAGVKLWEIAKGLGMSDASFSRKLREPLHFVLELISFDIIEKIKKEREVNNN